MNWVRKSLLHHIVIHPSEHPESEVESKRKESLKTNTSKEKFTSNCMFIYQYCKTETTEFFKGTVLVLNSAFVKTVKWKTSKLLNMQK